MVFSVAFGRREAIEILTVGLARPGIGGLDAGSEKFARRQRQLITVLRLALQERSAPIQACTSAPCARELAIHVGDEAAYGAGRRQLVGRDKRVIGGGQKCRLGRRQGEIGVFDGRAWGGALCRSLLRRGL